MLLARAFVSFDTLHSSLIDGCPPTHMEVPRCHVSLWAGHEAASIVLGIANFQEGDVLHKLPIPAVHLQGETSCFKPPTMEGQRVERTPWHPRGDGL